jgi:MoaA/NifB/PqqE/SkfB family radical SAM enzyme
LILRRREGKASRDFDGAVAQLREWWGARVCVRGNEAVVTLVPGVTRYTPGFVESCYRLLNDFEDRFQIRFEGAPYCFFPEALDHVHARAQKSAQHGLRCCSCRFRDICPGMAGGWGAQGLQVRPLSGVPQEITIELTKACNMHCSFCYHRPGKGAEARLSLPKVAGLLVEARRLGVRQVRFTGGEPLLYEKFPEALQMAKRSGFYVFVNTNALLLSRALIRAIRPYVDNVLVSFTPEESGAGSCSEGVLEHKGRMLQELVRQKVPYVRVGTVIDRRLQGRFEGISRLLLQAGVSRWELYRPMLEKSAYPEALPLYDLSLQEYHALFPLIRKNFRRGLFTYIANAFPYCALPRGSDRLFLKGASSDDGHSRRLVFDAEGFFKPSYFIRENLGATLRTALKHRYLDELNAWGYLPQQCKVCPLFSFCRAGSRYCASQEHRTYWSADPLMQQCSTP